VWPGGEAMHAYAHLRPGFHTLNNDRFIRKIGYEYFVESFTSRLSLPSLYFPT
jgi:hypothetical protein